MESNVYNMEGRGKFRLYSVLLSLKTCIIVNYLKDYKWISKEIHDALLLRLSKTQI